VNGLEKLIPLVGVATLKLDDAIVNVNPSLLGSLAMCGGSTVLVDVLDTYFNVRQACKNDVAE